MILYFSGTGNSAYAANRIGRRLKDDTVNLFERIKSNDVSKIHSDRPWVLVVPTYAWRIPRIVQQWLENVPMTGNRDIYFVMTCGGSMGNAGAYLTKLCAKKKLNYRGCMELVMPENYIALYSAPTDEKALEIIGRAEGVMDKAAHLIRNGRDFAQPKITLGDRMSSGIINTIFYPVFVHAKKFYATDACISCGKCVNVCPLSNVRLENGRPVWGDHCTHCMACICRCPSGAIEYGKHTKGLTRYVCPKK